MGSQSLRRGAVSRHQGNTECQPRPSVRPGTPRSGGGHGGERERPCPPTGPNPTVSSAAGRQRPTAHVIFGDNHDIWWLRFLAPGFRHCALILDTDEGIITLDPMSHKIELNHYPSPRLEPLLAATRRAGYRIVPTSIRPCAPIAAPWGPFSCVEVVKRVLGIHRRRILTPLQLYRFLLDDSDLGYYTYKRHSF